MSSRIGVVKLLLVLTSLKCSKLRRAAPNLHLDFLDDSNLALHGIVISIDFHTSIVILLF